MKRDPRLNNRYFARIVVSDFSFSPEKITGRIGIKPTEVQVEGQYRITNPLTGHKILNRENLWILSSDLPQNVEIEEQVKNLLEKIENAKEALKKAAQEFYVSMDCIIYYYEANPGIVFDGKVLRRISELGIPLTFDIYCMGSGLVFEKEESVRNIRKNLETLLTVKDVDSKIENLRQIELFNTRINHSLISDLDWEDLPETAIAERMDSIKKELIALKRVIDEFIK